MDSFINQIEPVYGDEEKKAVMDYLDSGGWIMEFKKTREFEEAISAFLGSKRCSVITNGTLTLFTALMALDIQPGDEVIVPNFTMIATPNAVRLAGAIPVLVDIDRSSLCIDVEEVKKKITKKTKAIFHVSINGRAGNLSSLMEVCNKQKIHLIEDAAQAFGSTYTGKKLGTFGVIGSYSFSAPKIITTGQGGALVTDDDDIFNKIVKIKDFGRIKGGIDIHDHMGWNFKFTDLQAAFGLAQLKSINDRIKKKREIYAEYKRLLSGIAQVEFLETNLDEVSPWFIDILVPEPQKLMVYLKENGIGSRLFYPPISAQAIYKDFATETFLVTEEVARRGLWLPSSVNLTNTQIAYVSERVRAYYA